MYSSRVAFHPMGRIGNGLKERNMNSLSQFSGPQKRKLAMAMAQVVERLTIDQKNLGSNPLGIRCFFNSFTSQINQIFALANEQSQNFREGFIETDLSIGTWF